MNIGEKIKTITEQAGFTVAESDIDSVLLFFDMGKGRSQRVMIRGIGNDKLGQKIIGISSPAMCFPANESLGQVTANKLLQENAKSAHGAWAIEVLEDKAYLVMMDTQILDTMQKEELRASIGAVAASADKLENELGEDNF